MSGRKINLNDLMNEKFAEEASKEKKLPQQQKNLHDLKTPALVKQYGFC